MLYEVITDIFNRQFQIPEESTFIKVNLKYNFRNTQLIGNYISDQTGIPIHTKETPEGIDVKEIAYSDFSDLRKQLGFEIQRLVTIEKLSCDDITIIVDGHLKDHPIKEVDNIAHYPLLSWREDEERDGKALHYTSINRFKGLESQVILLVVNGTEDFTGNKTFYTQCSRAKSILKVFRNAIH